MKENALPAAVIAIHVQILPNVCNVPNQLYLLVMFASINVQLDNMQIMEYANHAIIPVHHAQHQMFVKNVQHLIHWIPHPNVLRIVELDSIQITENVIHVQPLVKHALTALTALLAKINNCFKELYANHPALMATIIIMALVNNVPRAALNAQVRLHAQLVMKDILLKMELLNLDALMETI